MQFDHLNLNDTQRKLIRAISPKDAQTVFLAPLDKGLSGATVWLAEWQLPLSISTDLSVLKIGSKLKLEREMGAYNKIVKNLDNDVGTFEMAIDNDAGDAIIRQPFRGLKNKSISNLRTIFRNIHNPRDIERVIDDLYKKRMARWHPLDVQKTKTREVFSTTLKWWMSRYNLNAAVDSVGQIGLSGEIQRRFDINISDIDIAIQATLSREFTAVIGPIHGDLHAQNVLVDESGQLHLIDFGWTTNNWKAIDFILLECSCKFLVTPSHARLTDLLQMEALLEFSIDDELAESLINQIYGSRLRNVARAVNRIRRLCLDYGYVESEEDYFAGLLLMTAALASHPGLNRRYVINSLAYHVRERAST